MSTDPIDSPPSDRRPEAAADLADEANAAPFLDAAWGYAMRGSGLAVVLFEIDGLSRIEEQHGNIAVVQTRSAFGRILAEHTQRYDRSVPFGDRFLTILTDRRQRDAERFAADIRQTFGEVAFPWGPLSVGAGVSAVDPDMGSPDVLVAAADRALYLGRLGLDRSPAPPDLANETTSHPTLGSCRVLLVDDDEATLRSTRRMLERLGCEVTAAGSPREALGTVTSEAPIDLLVTDIVMPEMSGFTLVEIASRARSDLSVLYVSGYPQDEVYWGGTPGARSAFLGKPMEIEELDAAVRALLGLVDESSPNGVRPRANRRPSVHTQPALRQEKDGHILIVDDDEAVASSLQRLFHRAGYPRPSTVTRPERAAEMVAEQPVDLIILDLNMPGMDGFQVMEAIAPLVAREEYLPILMLTGDDTPDVRRRALQAGVMDFLTKPFDPAEAEARVRNLLRTRHLTERVADRRALLEEQVIERTAELADTRTEILHRLARAAEYRDDVTGRHAERVGLLSSLIASELGWGPRDVDFLRRTAPLHDIGKIGIPDSVLRKPGRLTPEEYETVQSHTVIGARILGGSRHRILEMASMIARGHHERWDGLGYPDRLAGEAIPPEARIVAVADVFDVLSHSRPYKNAVTPEETLGRIVQDRGTHFDPSVVDALDAIFHRVGAQRFLELVDPIDPSRDISSNVIAL